MINPLPILHYDAGYGMIALGRACHCSPTSTTMRKWIKGTDVPTHVHAVLLPTVLIAWGEQVRAGNRDTAQRLWNCYFPDSKPHVYHVLFGLFGIDTPRLAEWSGFTTAKVVKFLRQPKLTKRQLQAIGRPAMQYYEAAWSDRTWDGRDARAARIYQALRDQSRVYSSIDIRV